MLFLLRHGSLIWVWISYQMINTHAKLLYKTPAVTFSFTSSQICPTYFNAQKRNVAPFFFHCVYNRKTKMCLCVMYVCTYIYTYIYIYMHRYHEIQLLDRQLRWPDFTQHQTLLWPGNILIQEACCPTAHCLFLTCLLHPHPAFSTA